MSISRDLPEGTDIGKHWLQTFVSNNLNITHAFYTHPKILVTALNGPAVGLSAALIAFSDFIYCVPSTFLLTPFSSLGLVAEGGASRAFVQRLGITRHVRQQSREPAIGHSGSLRTRDQPVQRLVANRSRRNRLDHRLSHHPTPPPARDPPAFGAPLDDRHKSCAILPGSPTAGPA